jgi:hypothetical protein
MTIEEKQNGENQKEEIATIPAAIEEKQNGKK